MCTPGALDRTQDGTLSLMPVPYCTVLNACTLLYCTTLHVLHCPALYVLQGPPSA